MIRYLQRFEVLKKMHQRALKQEKRCLEWRKKKLRQIVTSIPHPVNEVYEAILRKSPDIERAWRLLHIVVAATRPLTLMEMNVALEIEESCTTIEDLDLVSEDWFRTTVRSLCGLFVAVIDSRVYLIHQTAKGFLIARRTVAKNTHQIAGADSSSHHLEAFAEAGRIKPHSCKDLRLVPPFHSV